MKQQTLVDAARAVIAMECERVNAGSGEPYDPIANPRQFDFRIVNLAKALIPEVPVDQAEKEEITAAIQRWVEKDLGNNAGIKCDRESGPCACGAWH